ncbi:TPA: Abi-alpha family protein [Streptococcus agalactiae]
MASHVFVDNLEKNDITIQSSSLTNLERLELIQINYKAHVNKKEYYNILNNSFIIKKNNELKEQNKRVLTNLGMITLTLFGVRFSKTCLPDVS